VVGIGTWELGIKHGKIVGPALPPSNGDDTNMVNNADRSRRTVQEPVLEVRTALQLQTCHARRLVPKGTPRGLLAATYLIAALA
jgi:hypothetical protein